MLFLVNPSCLRVIRAGSRYESYLPIQDSHGVPLICDETPAVHQTRWAGAIGHANLAYTTPTLL